MSTDLVNEEMEPINENPDTPIKEDAEYELIIKNFESIEQRLKEMHAKLENSIKWVSNICIIIILGMVVLVLIIAATTITMISKFV